MAICLLYKNHATPNFPPRLETCIQSWEVLLGILKDWRHLSQSWKELLDTHVLWLAYQVFEVDVATSTWLDIIPSLNHWGLVNDFWIRLVMAFCVH